VTDKILNCICSVFDLDRESVTSEISQSDVEGWDSIGSIQVILCLEEEFGVSISPEVGRRMIGCKEIEVELQKLGVVTR
jgi:Acyl carrier protein